MRGRRRRRSEGWIVFYVRARCEREERCTIGGSSLEIGREIDATDLIAALEI
jgi:hypothetical protein